MLEITGIAGLFACMAVISWKLAATTHDWSTAVLLGAAGLLGYILADLLSGIVHWAGDTVGDESWPVVGRNFIKHFRLHHLDQKDIVRHDFIETNGNNSIVAVGPAVAVTMLVPDDGSVTFLMATALSLFLSVFGTNQFHKWAHADETPRVARWLQRARLILPPEHHAIHHAAPHDKYYCITVGWLNPILQRLRFFRALEWIVARVNRRWLHIEERRGARTAA